MDLNEDVSRVHRSIIEDSNPQVPDLPPGRGWGRGGVGQRPFHCVALKLCVIGAGALAMNGPGEFHWLFQEAISPLRLV